MFTFTAMWKGALRVKGRLIDLTLGLNRKQRVTVELDADFRGRFDALKDADVEIDIKKFRLRRSKDANAYFHVLVNKIAQATGQSDSDVKQRLVIDWGVIDTDADGLHVAFKLPAGTDASKYYKYVRMYKETVENGLPVKCWAVYKPTHEMNTAEMAHLIDGAIAEAQELGIETDTPDQIARYKEEWKR